MLPCHKLARRVVFVSLAIAFALVATGANVVRHASPPPTFSFSFFHLIPSSLLLLSSSPSISAGQQQGQPLNTYHNSIGKSHRPSAGPFQLPPSLLVPSEDARFSTNRPPNIPPTVLQQANNEFILAQPKSNTNNNNNNKHDYSTRPYQQTTKMTPSPLLAHFPDPIVYQFTLYYPGNMPLIVTSGHGGWDIPVQRRMTHRFTPVDLSGPISVANFSTPVEDSNSDQPEIIPWMPERKKTKGSNLLRDVNTDSAALNVAGAVACVINQDLSGHHLSASSVPPQCVFAESDDYDVLPLMIPPSAKKPSALKTPSQGPSSQDNPSFYYPHVVIFRIPRQFVDVNRNDTGENAFADHPVAEAAWNEYHDLIDHVQKIVSQGHDELKGPKKPKEPSESSGLLLDIHGHAHAANLIEVGYLLNGTTLALDDTQLDAHAHVLTNLTSVRSLENIIQQDPNPSDRENRDPSKITFSDFLRGQDDSLGGMLQAQGLDALPSPRHPAPARGATYFYGGYTTRRHGSRDRKEEGAMDAIQLEMPKTLRFVDKEQAREIGMRIGRAVGEFMARYYNFPPRGSRCVGHARSDERERGLEHSDEVRMTKSIKDICTKHGSDDHGV